MTIKLEIARNILLERAERFDEMAREYEEAVAKDIERMEYTKKQAAKLRSDAAAIREEVGERAANSEVSAA